MVPLEPLQLQSLPLCPSGFLPLRMLRMSSLLRESEGLLSLRMERKKMRMSSMMPDKNQYNRDGACLILYIIYIHHPKLPLYMPQQQHNNTIKESNLSRYDKMLQAIAMQIRAATHNNTNYLLQITIASNPATSILSNLLILKAGFAQPSHIQCQIGDLQAMVSGNVSVKVISGNDSAKVTSQQITLYLAHQKPPLLLKQPDPLPLWVRNRTYHIPSSPQNLVFPLMLASWHQLFRVYHIVVVPVILNYQQIANQHIDFVPIYVDVGSKRVAIALQDVDYLLFSPDLILHIRRSHMVGVGQVLEVQRLYQTELAQIFGLAGQVLLEAVCPVAGNDSTGDEISEEELILGEVGLQVLYEMLLDFVAVRLEQLRVGVQQSEHELDVVGFAFVIWHLTHISYQL